MRLSVLDNLAYHKSIVNLISEMGRAIQFSSFSGHFREDRDSEIAPTGEGRVAIRRSLGQKRGGRDSEIAPTGEGRVAIRRSLGQKRGGRDSEIAPTGEGRVAIRRSLGQRRGGSRFGDRSYRGGEGRDSEIAPTEE